MRNENGYGLLDFLISFTILVFLLMQPLDAFVLQSKHQMAEKIVNKYLARMRLEGGLTSADQNNLVTEFGNIGCTIANPATDIVANAKSGQNRILRSSDPATSEVSLTVTCTPNPQPFKPIRLIDRTEGVTTIKVGGKDLSERVNSGVLP